MHRTSVVRRNPRQLGLPDIACFHLLYLIIIDLQSGMVTDLSHQCIPDYIDRGNLEWSRVFAASVSLIIIDLTIWNGHRVFAISVSLS